MREQQLGDRALESVCLLESLASVNRTRDDVKQEFLKWFSDVALQLIFQAEGEMELEEEDGSEASDLEVEDSIPAPEPEVANVMMLQDLQLQAQLKEDISELQEPKPGRNWQPTLEDMLKNAGLNHPAKSCLLPLITHSRGFFC